MYGFLIKSALHIAVAIIVVALMAPVWESFGDTLGGVTSIITKSLEGAIK